MFYLNFIPRDIFKTGGIVIRKITRKVNNTFLIITIYIVKISRIFFCRKLRYMLINYRISHEYLIL